MDRRRGRVHRRGDRGSVAGRQEEREGDGAPTSPECGVGTGRGYTIGRLGGPRCAVSCRRLLASTGHVPPRRPSRSSHRMAPLLTSHGGALRTVPADSRCSTVQCRPFIVTAAIFRGDGLRPYCSAVFFVFVFFFPAVCGFVADFNSLSDVVWPTL